MSIKGKLEPTEFLRKESVVRPTLDKMQYDKSLQSEITEGNLTKEDALELYSQMRWLREFELLLNSLKYNKSYNGIDFDYVGPAHLELGEEAAIIGLNWLLNENDFTFGSHRSHGEVLGKTFTSIYNMNDEVILNFIKEHNEGSTYRAVSENIEGFNSLSIKEQARQFIIYAMLTEIFSRETGLNRGIAGSMHMFFKPFGSYPNNGVVGGSFAFGHGAALYKLINKKPGIGVSYIGDGGAATGPFWETVNMAAMDQYKNLWPEGYNKRPPFMINAINNSYAISADTMNETMGNKGPALIGHGVNPEGLHAEVVDGQNVLAVIDLIRRKKPIVENGDGPVLNEVRTYRFEDHAFSGNLGQAYRSMEELETWQIDYDPLVLFSKEILEANVATEEELNAIDNNILETIKPLFAIAVDKDISPALWDKAMKDDTYLDDYLFSREDREINKDIENVLDGSKLDNDKYKDLQSKDRTTLGMSEADFEAVMDRFEKDPEFIVFSQDARENGGVGQIYKGANQTVPRHRLFNTPINEAGMVGTAIGYAMAGGQALVQLTSFNFMFRAGDELSNQLSKWRAMSGKHFKLPVVIRSAIFHYLGVQHSEDYTSTLAGFTGLNVQFPTTAYDAKGTMARALELADPTYIVEDSTNWANPNPYNVEVPREHYIIEQGKSVVRTEGNDITIVALGAANNAAREAVSKLKEYNVNVELIDLRSVVPLDYSTILESVRKTKNVILVNNGFERTTFMNRVGQTITEQLFDELNSAPVVLGGRNLVSPNGDNDAWIYPQVDNILSAIDERIFKLEGFTQTRNHSKQEQLRRYKLGV